MIYCMSDIHGELNRWYQMLELIRFSDADTLYVLGDVIDRKPHGVELLRDITRRPNVHMILGNHEQMMLDSFWAHDTYEARKLWKRNGGSCTHKSMAYQIPVEERLRLLRYVQGLPDQLEIAVNGRVFHLVHGYIGETRHDRIWGRPEPVPTTPPLPGKTIICGHTCTYFLNLNREGYDATAPFEIFHAPGLIDIDTGCGNDLETCRLACLRLDDMKEFYV